MTEFKNFLEKNSSDNFSKKSQNKIIINHQSFLDFYSNALNRVIKFDIYAPQHALENKASLSLLLLNDGQDLKAVKVQNALKDFHLSNPLNPLLVVGLFPEGNRMQEYGTSGQPDYLNRGAKAGDYTRFITEELLPHLSSTYNLINDPAHRAFAGFSLGGLSAIDICWCHPQLFGTAGVFSGSLWWRSLEFSEAEPDANRIMHLRIRNGRHTKGLRFWFQTGTLDESCDRNNNGIIDSIDDTVDLIKELKTLGYPDHDIHYLEVEGGQHNPKTWAKVMPQFLEWAFGRKDN